MDLLTGIVLMVAFFVAARTNFEPCLEKHVMHIA